MNRLAAPKTQQPHKRPEATTWAHVLIHPYPLFDAVAGAGLAWASHRGSRGSNCPYGVCSTPRSLTYPRRPDGSLTRSHTLEVPKPDTVALGPGTWQTRFCIGPTEMVPMTPQV